MSYEFRRQAKARGYTFHENGELHHRAVWEQTFGKIRPGWVVHHVNETKSDNRLENLVALPSSLHDDVHRLQRQLAIRFNVGHLRNIAEYVAQQEDQLDEKANELHNRIHALNRERENLGKDVLRSTRHKASPVKPAELKGL